MADAKLIPTERSPVAFIERLEPARRREEAKALLPMFARLTGEPPVMWGDKIIGFGEYAYHYDSGRRGRWFLTGYCPRKTALSIYIVPGFQAYGDLLSRLGKHRHSVACLYVNTLADIDMDVLQALVARSVADMREAHGQEAHGQ
jgi:hypothetical protein